MSDKPIGIFDSGVGGTSIWKEIQKLMPYENTIYLADSANAPYGAKSQEDILALSIKNTELLLDKGCKLIVVACNTATTNAISHLRQHYDVPFIGIEPAIKPAALKSKSRKVGVLATKGTLASSLFHSTSENHAAGIEILEQEGSGLVPLIEEGEIQTDATKKLLQRYLIQEILSHRFRTENPRNTISLAATLAATNSFVLSMSACVCVYVCVFVRLCVCA